MTTNTPKPTVDKLLKQISAEYEHLSKQLKLIARYFETHKDHVGLDGIQDVARACSVQPSAVVRFAKHFGFTGFSEMQRVFRDALSKQVAPTRNYKSRIREAIEAHPGTASGSDIAQEFLTGSIDGMTALVRQFDPKAFNKAVDVLVDADTLWIAGSRRSFPVAAYLDYALQHTDKRVHLVTALGSMQDGQMRSVREGDALLAISFAPYADETLALIQAAQQRKAKILAITDSRMSPLAKAAQVSLLVEEPSTFGFRSMTSTMALAQSLFVAVAYRLELMYQPTTPV